METESFSQDHRVRFDCKVPGSVVPEYALTSPLTLVIIKVTLSARLFLAELHDKHFTYSPANTLCSPTIWAPVLPLNRWPNGENDV